MKIPEPNRQWFGYAILAAWAIAAVGAIVQCAPLWDSLPEAIGGLIALAIFGTLTFPLGLPSFFFSSGTSLAVASLPLTAAGWIIIVGLTTLGAWRKSRIVFVVLVTLLLLNAAGCVARWDFLEDAMSIAD